MGRAKLLLPWRGATVIERVLAAWLEGGVARRVVVTHRDDVELAQVARAAGAEVVTPEIPPPEMKASIRAALDYLAERDHPGPNAMWLLAPADMPGLSPGVIRALLKAASQHPGAILVPAHHGRRGHPVLFRWPMAAPVETLADDQGVNELLKRFPTVEIPVDDGGGFEDLDTPEDYERSQPNL
jgi:molybdenum cofactor cytidylyltransferase